MKKKIIVTFYIVMICVTIKLLSNIFLNNRLIEKYNNGDYSESTARSLTFLNIFQRYIAHYNYGNILYKNGKYEEANIEYENALKESIPKYQECSIRINYALSICKTVQLDESNQESIEKAIEIYESAIDVLIQDGCANKNDDNGHSEDAEQLKKDIQKEIERLKKKTKKTKKIKMKTKKKLILLRKRLKK